MSRGWFVPDWPVPPGVRAVSTTREGGVSPPPFAGFNLADHVGDAPEAVARNRAALLTGVPLPQAPRWLRQVHGTTVVDLDRCPQTQPEGDAALTRIPGRVCAVLTADCLPVLLCDAEASVVAAVHAGWRGLAAGVLETTVAAMGRAGVTLSAWLGPAIGPEAFVVGGEVRRAFVTGDPGAERCFHPHGDRWRADLFALARRRLEALGVTVYGGGRCTWSDGRFFSYRRDGVTGRMASLIWLEAR